MATPDLPLHRLPELLAELEHNGAGLRDSHYKLLTLAPRPQHVGEASVIRHQADRWREEVQNLNLVEAQLQRWSNTATTTQQHQELKRFKAALERYRAYVTACTLAAERLLHAERPLQGPFVTRPITHLIVLQEWVMDASENTLAILESLHQNGAVVSDLDHDSRQRLTTVHERVSVDARAFLNVIEHWQTESIGADTLASVTQLGQTLGTLMKAAEKIVAGA